MPLTTEERRARDNVQALARYHRTKHLTTDEQRLRANARRLARYHRTKHLNNSEEMIKRREYASRRRQSLKETLSPEEKANKRKVANKGEAARIASDENYRLSVRLRVRLATAVKRQTKSGSAVRDLGCSIAELRTYLEKQFQPGMTWDNWSRTGWHIDHIKPLCKFDLTDREQLLQACHYTNLQPLWAVENLRKHKATYADPSSA